MQLKSGQKLIWRHDGREERVTFSWANERPPACEQDEPTATVRREDGSYATVRVRDLNPA